MDEKGFTLGTTKKVKVMARASRRPPRAAHDGIRELVTVIEACGAKRVMLPVMVVFKGTAHYKLKTGIPRLQMKSTRISPIVQKVCSVPGILCTIYPSNSPKVYAADEIGLDWLKKKKMYTPS